MKHKLEEQMQELADTASLKELMPEFDKEAMWQEVATQLQEEKGKSRKIALGWLSHAAAVIVAILTTYAIMHYTRPEQSPAVATHTPVPAPIQSGTTHQAVVLPAPATLPQSTASNTLPTNSAGQITGTSKTIPTRQQTLQPVPSILPAPVTTIPAPQETMPPPVIIAATAHKKVVHYLDLDAEVQPAPAAAPAPPPAFVQMKLNKPDIPNSDQKTALGTLALALGPTK